MNEVTFLSLRVWLWFVCVKDARMSPFFFKGGAWFDYVTGFHSANPFIAYWFILQILVSSERRLEWPLAAHTILCETLCGMVRGAGGGGGGRDGWLEEALQNDALREAQWVDVRGNKKSACASLKTENANETRAPAEAPSVDTGQEAALRCMLSQILHTGGQSVPPADRGSCILTFRPLVYGREVHCWPLERATYQL